MGSEAKLDSVTIRPARGSSDLRATVRLFTAYSEWLGIDLTFQNFETELSTLPGKYENPKGEILLASASDDVVGCIAIRPLTYDGSCEMKRLYVAPHGRGLGIGRKLLDAILETASSMGYREIRLDTLKTMVQAIKLYEKAGFEQTTAYYDTPVVDTLFLVRRLSNWESEPDAGQNSTEKCRQSK